MELDYVDSGRAFDWGKAAQDYSKYRDIYPPEFYEALHFFGVGGNGKRLLEIKVQTLIQFSDSLAA